MGSRTCCSDRADIVAWYTHTTWHTAQFRNSSVPAVQLQHGSVPAHCCGGSLLIRLALSLFLSLSPSLQPGVLLQTRQAAKWIFKLSLNFSISKSADALPSVCQLLNRQITNVSISSCMFEYTPMRLPADERTPRPSHANPDEASVQRGQKKRYFRSLGWENAPFLPQVSFCVHGKPYLHTVGP